ncbi:MAG: DinB family protein [Roseiflexaceae bacterium]
MHISMLRHFVAYHIAENSTLWSYIDQLSAEQFVADIPYAHGSIRNQLVHMLSVDTTWLAGLRGLPIPEPLDPMQFDSPTHLKVVWDDMAHQVHSYVMALSDADLMTQPLTDEDAMLHVGQVLLHLVNHGTDHRAQLLRCVHDAGIKTVSQDYIFYAYDYPL